MIDSVREQIDGSFEVCFNDPGRNDMKLKHNPFFVDNETFWS